MLTSDKIQEYQKKMESERARLMDQIGKLEKPEEFGSDVEDFSEEQEEAESFAGDVAAGQALKERVNEIDAALNKIRAGEYGKCEKCGMEISEKELDLVPESQLCEHCK